MTETLYAVEVGVNVVVWSAIKLLGNTSERYVPQPAIQGGPDYKCVATVRSELQARGLNATHLVSVGSIQQGSYTSFSGAEWFSAWHKWNSALPLPFDGLDWHLEIKEGNPEYATLFTPELYGVVLNTTLHLRNAGYVVTMQSAQSYLDPTTQLFNRSLSNAYVDYHPDFYHHGLNCYAYLLAVAPPGLFNLVSVMLYETWSRASQAVYENHSDPAEYLENITTAMIRGWTVDFNDPSLLVQGKKEVRINQTQLIIGLSFGSPISDSSFTILPSIAKTAYLEADPAQRPRGYSVWSIKNEYRGWGYVNGAGQQLRFVDHLNDFLEIRNTTEREHLVDTPATPATTPTTTTMATATGMTSTIRIEADRQYAEVDHHGNGFLNHHRKYQHHELMVSNMSNC